MRGFKNLSQLTPAEQITLALETDVLLGLHGAGFTHMVWMKRGSVLFEGESRSRFDILRLLEKMVR